jgi:predicted ester cyclase
MTDARTLVERVFAVIDGQRWDGSDAVMHPDVEVVTPLATVHGTGEWAQLVGSFAGAMPDGRHHVSNVVQDGERFAVEGAWTGTHTGPLAGPGGEVPATGRTVTLPFCAVGTQREGRLAAVTIRFDQLGMLAQLGLVPSPATAGR